MYLVNGIGIVPRFIPELKNAIHTERNPSASAAIAIDVFGR
jgi:hypothetical protein